MCFQFVLYMMKTIIYDVKGGGETNIIGPNDFHHSNALGQKMHF